MDNSWGPRLRSLLGLCWHQDPGRQPAASKASAILKREASKVAGADAADLNSFRRKSTFVNRESLRERRAITP